MARPLTRPRSPTCTRHRRSLASRRSRLSPLVKPGTKPTKPSKPKVTIFKPQVQVAPSADAVKTLAKTGSTTGAIVIAALFAAIANPSTSRRFQAPLIPRAVGISASMVNTDRLCRAISTHPFLPRLHPLCSALRHTVLRGYPSYSVTPLINPLGSIVLPRILFAVSPFRRVPFLRVSFAAFFSASPSPPSSSYLVHRYITGSNSRYSQLHVRNGRFWALKRPFRTGNTR